MINRFIAQCEKEVLHLSGTIQPHGALLIASPNGIVTHASANIALFLGAPVSELLDRPLPATLAKLLTLLPAGKGQKQACINALDAVNPLDVMLSRDDSDNLLFELFRFSPLPIRA